MNVVLIGMKHCGKSTLGRALAARWACPFHDVDPMIEATHACSHGEQLSVRDILGKHGESHFRRIEGHVVCELYLKLDRPGSRAVVALGGRTALNPAVCELLRAIGLVVYLRLAPEQLYARIQQAGLPPFLNDEDPHRAFLDLFRQRHPTYQRLADVEVDLDGLGVEAAVDLLERRIEEHGGARQ